MSDNNVGFITFMSIPVSRVPILLDQIIAEWIEDIESRLDRGDFDGAYDAASELLQMIRQRRNYESEHVTHSRASASE